MNFYTNTDSKLTEIKRYYYEVNKKLNLLGIDLIWITDGLGWKTTTKSLFETFLHNDYLLNIEMIKQGTLKDIIL